MIKKLVSILSFSLIISGLLFGGDTDSAFEYYANGQSQVGFDSTNFQYVTKITYGDAILIPSEDTCPYDGIFGNKCTLQKDGQYKVTVEFSDQPGAQIGSLYLNLTNNITKVENYNGVKINTLDLSNNSNIQLNNFYSSRIPNIIIKNSNLTDFDIALNYNDSFENIHFEDNLLTTIPDEIRNNRDTYDIKLSDTTSYHPNNNNKRIFLNGNPIKFVGITKIDNTDNVTVIDTYQNHETNNCGYSFERFGYSGTDIPLTYNYEIIDEYNNTVESASNPDRLSTNGNMGMANIGICLKPGNYTFKVCIDDDSNTCDTVDFHVSYDAYIDITNSSHNAQPLWEGAELSSRENISFYWNRRGTYPIQLISGYKYTLTKNGSTIDSETLPKDEYHYQPNTSSRDNANYNFTIELINTDGQTIAYADRPFSLMLDDPTLTINKPQSHETSVVTQFSWTPNLPDYFSSSNYQFTKYEYSVNGPVSTGGIKTNENDTSFSLNDLPDGNYVFEIIMYYKFDGQNKSIQAQQDFNMTASEAPNVTILSPTGDITDSNVNKTNILFKWTGGGTQFHHYNYTIKQGETIITGKNNIITNDATNRQFYYELENGIYTFNVEMFNSSSTTPIALDSVTFNVTIPSTVTIQSPISGANLSNKTNTFTWTGFTPYNFINYEYEIRKGNTLITGGTKDFNDPSVSVKNLHNGEDYTFKIIMNYNNGVPQSETDQISFKVTASNGAYLNITSPNKITYTGNCIKKVPVNFNWNGGNSALIEKYSYKIINTTTNSQVTGGTINKNIDGNYSIPGEYLNLPSGTYRFEVTMLDDEDVPIIGTESYSFNVIIPPNIQIITPPAGQLNTKDIDFAWSGFAEFEHHYKYYINGIHPDTNAVISQLTGNNNSPLTKTGFQINNIHNGKYIFTVVIMDSNDKPIITGDQTFRIPDDKDLILDILNGDTSIIDTIKPTTPVFNTTTGVFSWGGKSEDFYGYYYSITGTTFTGAAYVKAGTTTGNTTGKVVLDLPTGRYRFYVKMIDNNNGTIIEKYKDFNVEIPARLTITSPSEGAKIESATATVSWTGYNDTTPLYSYMIKKGSTVLDTSNLTDNTSFTRNDLSNGSYSVTVYMLSGWAEVATKTVNFTVDIPVKPSGGGGSSSKSHPTNNLKLSIGNESPSNNEWIELIVKIDEKYTGKVTFPKIQYYSGSKWIDIPVTSKNYISDYSDDAKLGYVKFSSDDDGKKNLSQFIKFAKNGHYRIYAEDKDGYDTYVQLQIGPKKVEVTTGHNTAPDTDEEIYIARSCKKYTIIYSDTLNIYTSPNLNISEFFMNKDYLKRYLDSKNRYQSGCPTNIGWITTSYVDRTNDDERYTAPNGKVYFIVGEEGDYYSNELNRELKTPTSFKSIQELKFYIRDRNPLINMAALGPVS